MRRVLSRRVTRRRFRPRNGTSKLRKTVAALVRTVNQTIGHHTRKTVGQTRLTVDIGDVAETAYAFSVTTMENDLSALRYYDPANPATLVTAAGGTGTYTRNFRFTSIYHKLEAINNYCVPIIVDLYIWGPKNETNQSPINAEANGIADQVVNLNTNTNNQLIRPSELQMVRSEWKILAHVRRTLLPGKRTKLRWNDKNINFKPSVFDTETLGYQKKFASRSLMIRIQGVLGHDLVDVNNLATLGGAVDTRYTRISKIVYDAGVALRDISIDDNTSKQGDTFTGGLAVSLRPISEQAQPCVPEA